MGILSSWWQKLTGRSGSDPAPARGPASRTRARASGTAQRRVAPQMGSATEEPEPKLKLEDGPAPKKPAKVGAAGFDPYTSDAGFAKPHSWERVDHD